MVNEQIDDAAILAFEAIEKDKVDPNDSGFFWHGHGRAGNIYFVENQFIVLFYCEMPGTRKYDVLIFGETEHIKRRYYPTEKRFENIPLEERFRIQCLLVEWLASKGWRHDISVGT